MNERTITMKRLVVFCLLAFLLGMSGCARQKATQTIKTRPQPASVPLATIEAIKAFQEEGRVQVAIDADKPLTYTSVKQPDPLAVLLFFPNTRLAEVPSTLPGLDPLIQEIKTATAKNANTVRVEILLGKDVPYKVEEAGTKLLLSFGTLPAQGQKSNAAESSRQVETAAKTAPAAGAAVKASKPVPAVKVNPSGRIAWINKIDFLAEPKGKSTIVIGTTVPADYKLEKKTAKRLELVLYNTKIPTYRRRALITTRFESAVNRITPVQKSAKQASVVIELRESVPYFTERSGNLLLVHFEASRIPPKPLEQAHLPAWKKALSGGEMEPASGDMKTMTKPAGIDAETGAVTSTVAELPPAKAAPSPAESFEAAAVESAWLSPRKKHYTGEKIALDFYETDIKNVFRILRDISGKNFAIDKDVTGKVTMTLEKPVPWDQILDLVLRMNQLGMSVEGDIIRIATLDTLKKEDDLRKAQMEALKKAKEQAKELEPLETKYIPVSYSNAKKEILPHIEKILSPKRGNATVDEKNNQIIITDTAAKIKQAEEIVRRIDRVTSQVLIEARVVEVSENWSKTLGIVWNSTYGPGNLFGSGISSTTDFAMNFPASGATSGIGFNFSRVSGGIPFVLNAQINALESEGQGRILSSPKILTLDNKTARIKQGLEYPYLERDSSGGASVKFKKIDLLLEVTPHVTPDNRISLSIFITKNDVASVTDGVPSVATNEAETELLVNDGDTIVIGGIIKATTTDSTSGFPLLSKIPILGWLFKNNTKSQQKNELLIFMTPRIVQLEQHNTM